MEKIIKKAFIGGYEVKQYSENFALNNDFVVFDPLFWQSLAKACGWGNMAFNLENLNTKQRRKFGYEYQWHYIRFMEINLTEGWNKAISYLESIIN